MIVGTLKPITYTRPLVGSLAVLPQFDPPWLPGMWITSSKPIGVNGPSLRAGDALPDLIPLLGRQDVRVDVIHGERLPDERRRVCRERLRRRQLLPGHG